MKDRLFLDTNIVLDLLGERDPFYLPAAKIASLSDRGEIDIVVSALTYSTVYYVLSKFEGKEVAREKVRKFKVLAQTADLTDQIIDKALLSKFKDLEDALQYYCALGQQCNLIITRNGGDFKNSEIPVLGPDEYLKSLPAK